VIENMNKRQGISSKTPIQEQLNHYANQHTPNILEYKSNQDNRSQLFLNHNLSYKKESNHNDQLSLFPIHMGGQK